jgi:hypothetical protein
MREVVLGFVGDDTLLMHNIPIIKNSFINAGFIVIVGF